MKMGCLWKESVPLIRGNSSELRCRRQVRWFLPLHQSGRVLDKQISIVCKEVAPELLFSSPCRSSYHSI